MDVEGICQHCHRSLSRRRHLPNQTFCRQKPCQNARKNKWRKEKLASDADYKADQRDAQRRWREKNPGYSRSYRERHPGYVGANRSGQKIRNMRRRPPGSGPPLIAKSDASHEKNSLNPGLYIIQRVEADGIAKSDASFVRITSISMSCAHRPSAFGDCKEMT
jgi:hypothetical protein